MPTIVDYEDVLARMHALGLVCVYYNSGSFGFPQRDDVQIVGWIGPEDSTIRPGVARKLVAVPPPYEINLAARLSELWATRLSGPAWVVPKSHWSFELGHGTGGPLREWLVSHHLDPKPLEEQANAAAIAFDPESNDRAATEFASLVAVLLTELKASDFAVLFPAHRHLVTLHHHKQIWWQTADPAWADVVAAVNWQRSERL